MNSCGDHVDAQTGRVVHRCTSEDPEYLEMRPICSGTGIYSPTDEMDTMSDVIPPPAPTDPQVYEPFADNRQSIVTVVPASSRIQECALDLSRPPLPPRKFVFFFLFNFNFIVN